MRHKSPGPLKGGFLFIPLAQQKQQRVGAVAAAATAAVLFLSCFFIFFLSSIFSLPFFFFIEEKEQVEIIIFLSYLFISPTESSKRRGISPPADEYQTLDGTELLYLSTSLYNPSSIHTAITHHRSNLHLHFDVVLPFVFLIFLTTEGVMD